MKTEADIALENVLVFDVKKDGIAQRQNGDWVIRLTVAQLDMHQVIVNANMGAIFQCTLVQKNDDGTAVDHKAEGRSKWRDLGATKQAALRCKQPTFWAFMREVWECDEVVDEESCATAVRDYCEIESRSDLSKREFMQAQISWHRLDNAFEGWKAAEHA